MILTDKILYNKVTVIFDERDYTFFSAGNLNLNLIGIRSLNWNTNMFDDELVIFFKDDGNWIVKKYQITTDPGRHYLKNPMEKTGTAILCTGQYKGMFKLGKHRGRYDALVQARPVRVYRDNDRDDELDMNVNITETGMFGINMHRSSPYSKSYTVEKWSAGCQVFASSSQYNQFMRLIKISAKKYGQFFSYTLLGEADFY